MADPSWVMASIYFDWQFDGGRDLCHSGIRFRSRMSTIISVSFALSSDDSWNDANERVAPERRSSWLWFPLIRHGHACAANGYINFVWMQTATPLPLIAFLSPEREFDERERPCCWLFLARFPNKRMACFTCPGTSDRTKSWNRKYCFPTAYRSSANIAPLFVRM